MKQWIAAIALLLLLLAYPARSHAQPAWASCAAGVPVKDWFDAKTRFKVLSGCVVATGRVREIRSQNSAVGFELVPDKGGVHLLNAHNISLLGGSIFVFVSGRSRIHGTLRNGSRVQVAAPWVHDLTAGWNELASAQYVKVLPAAISASQPSKPVKAPTAAPVAAFTVRAAVTPNSMPYNAYPVLTAFTRAGVSCSASVVYSTGRTPVSFNGSAQTVGTSGSVSWTWHEETKGTGGTANVVCTLNGQSASAQASFSVGG